MPSLSNHLSFLILISLITLSACSIRSTQKNKILSIENKKWVIRNTSKQAIFNGMSITLNSSTNELSGLMRCNNLNGAYTLENNNLSFSNIISTYKACEGIEDEVEFVKMLRSVRQYEIKKNELYLKTGNKTLAILK